MADRKEPAYPEAFDGEIQRNKENVGVSGEEDRGEMRCSECAEGRRYTAGSWYCVMYGMIIREKDHCTRKGARQRERDEDIGGEVPGEDPAGDVSGVPA